MQKMCCRWCSILLLVLLLPFSNVCAETSPAVSMGLSVPPVVHSGDEFTATLYLHDFSPGCPPIIAFPQRLSLSFDTSQFELLDYQAGSSVDFSLYQTPDDSHPYIEGFLNVSDNAGIGPDTVLLFLRFRVSKTAPGGTYTFGLKSSSHYALGIDEQSIRLRLSNAMITVEYAPSSDTTLHSLRVPGYTLRPGFDPTVLSYTLQVPAYVSDIGVQYTADDHASVSISGDPHALKQGENTLVITVTAENGNQRSYTLVVYRAFADSSTTAGFPENTSTHVPPASTFPSSAPASSASFPASSQSQTSVSGAAAETEITMPLPSSSPPGTSAMPLLSSPPSGAAAMPPDATGPQPVNSASSGLYWLLIPLAALLIAAYILVVHFMDKRKQNGEGTEPPQQ